MKKRTFGTLVLAVAVCIPFVFRAGVFSDERRAAEQPPAGKVERPYGIAQRAPWTTSRLTGTPDPPPPYKVVRSFPKLMFKNPLLITMAPGSDRFFIGEQAGKLYSFPNDQNCAKVVLYDAATTEIHSWDT